MFPYLALLRMGFTSPARVAASAVVSYTTVSPVPAAPLGGSTCAQAHVPFSTYANAHAALFQDFGVRAYAPTPIPRHRRFAFCCTFRRLAAPGR